MVTVFAETDLDLIHRIANSDAVRPFIRPDGAETDWSPLAHLSPAISRTLILSNGIDAVAAFEQTAPGVFQAHTLFAETCRGRKAIDTAREMLAWMFERGAEVIWGTTPRANKRACWFNRYCGASELPTSDDEDIVFEIRRARWTD